MVTFKLVLVALLGLTLQFSLGPAIDIYTCFIVNVNIKVYGDDAAHQLKKMTDYKTLAKGMMDLALFSANANQLK